MSEELDSPKWTLPPLLPIIIGLVIVGIAVAAIFTVGRAKPGAEGAITKVFAVQQPGTERVLAGVEFRIRNLNPPKEIAPRDQVLFFNNMRVTLETASGEYVDIPAPVVDLPRYFRAFPGLQQSTADPFSNETQIPVGEERSGFVVVGFPVSQEEFQQRKNLKVTVNFRRHRPLVLESK